MSDLIEQKLRQIFARRLQLARRAANLTQEELAERIDRTVDMISRLERHAASPSLATVARLSDALGISASELFIDDTAEFRLTSQLDTTDLDALFELVASAPPGKVERLTALLKVFLN